jgi:hypothetical protein
MAAGVTPEQIYETLLANGYSSVQAFGIMGNMICESSLDPEQVNPGARRMASGCVSGRPPTIPTRPAWLPVTRCRTWTTRSGFWHSTP